jgi:TATA-box binding protein (TBP) (component of TFIID and TFIIIB)
VAKADLGWRVDIGRLCEERNVVRNDNFPGVVYKQLRFVKSALVFGSGKVVLTGARNKSDIGNAYLELRSKVEQFRRK